MQDQSSPLAQSCGPLGTHRDGGHFPGQLFWPVRIFVPLSLLSVCLLAWMSLEKEGAALTWWSLTQKFHWSSLAPHCGSSHVSAGSAGLLLAAGLEGMVLNL